MEHWILCITLVGQLCQTIYSIMITKNNNCVCHFEKQDYP